MRLLTLAAGTTLLAVSAAAHASFIDTTIKLDTISITDGAETEYATLTAPVVIGSTEFVAYAPGLEPVFDVDIEAYTIHVDHFVVQDPTNDHFGDPEFNGLRFSYASNLRPAIQSVDVFDGANPIVGVTATSSDDVIELNWSALPFDGSSTVDLRVTFVGEQDPTAIPEPSALAVAAGATIALLRRRQRPSTKSSRSL